MNPSAHRNRGLKRLAGRHLRGARSVQLALEALEKRELLAISVLPPPRLNASSPGPLTNVDGTLFFTRTDPSQGLELWRTDGTSAGTVEVRGWSPGYWSATNPQLTNVNGTLYFVADSGYGEELWKSNGTAAGTVQVADINPGPGDSNPTALTNFNGTLFFTADDGTHGGQLWKSDGTAAGTTMMIDLNPTGSPTGPTVDNDWAAGPLLYFEVDQDTTGNAGDSLWVSNGTASGTHQLALPGGLNSIHIEQVLYADGVAFVNGDSGLWKTDGTTATPLAISGDLAQSEFSVSQLTNVNGIVYFIESGQSGAELYKTDGTTTGSGTAAVAGPFSDTIPPGWLTNVAGTLFFAADDGTHGAQLWKSDGTSGGTLMVTDINPGVTGLDPVNLTNFNSTLYFTAASGANQAVWTTNGTAAGTGVATNLLPEAEGAGIEWLQAVNGFLFFDNVTSLLGGSPGQAELWKTDGSAAGTSQVGTFTVQNNIWLPFGPPWVPPTTIATAGTGLAQETFAVTPQHDLYEYRPASGWKLIAENVQSISAVQETSASPQVVLFAVTTENALFEYSDDSGWQLIGGQNTVQEISAGTDAAGRADVFVIGGDTALSEWSTSTGWLPSPIGGAGSINSISAINGDRVVVVTAGQAIYEHDDHFGWFPLTSNGFAQSISTVVDGTGRLVVFATTVGGALFRHEDATGWTQLGAPGTIEQSGPSMILPMTAGTDASGQADVYVITTSKQLAVNDPITGWSTLSSPDTPSSVALSGTDEAIVLMRDGSIDGYDPRYGFFALASVGFASVGPELLGGG